MHSNKQSPTLQEFLIALSKGGAHKNKHQKHPRLHMRYLFTDCSDLQFESRLSTSVCNLVQPQHRKSQILHFGKTFSPFYCWKNYRNFQYKNEKILH